MSQFDSGDLRRFKTVRNHWPTTGRRGKMWTAMEGNRNGTAPTPEVKLLTALEPHLEKLSDDEIAAKIAVTEKILADRAGAQAASRPKRVAQSR